MLDISGYTALHYAASSGNPELIKQVIAQYSEGERLRAVSEECSLGTVLHCAARSGNFQCLQALNRTSQYGETVLHCAADSNDVECIKAVLSLYPESERLTALERENEEERTVLEDVTEKTRDAIMEWLSKSERSHDVAHPQQDEGVDVDQLEAKRPRSQ